MGGVSGEEGACVRELMGDADAGGEEEDGAVGEEGVETAVGPFEEAGEVDGSGGGGAGAGVEAGGHAGAFADDEGHACGGAVGEGGVEVGGGGGEFGEGGGEREGFRGGPGDGEGVRHPEGEGWDVDVGVGAGAESPGTRHGEGEAAGVGGEGLDGQRGQTVAGEVAVDDAEPTDAAVEDPEEDDGFDVVELGEMAADGVDVDAEEGEKGEELVEVEEGFVEGVADGGGGLDEDEAKGAGAEEAVL